MNIEKVKINGSLKSKEVNYNFSSVGEISNKIISYDDGDVSVEIDIANNIMKRTNENYEIIFNFIKDEKTSNVLNLIDLGQTINMDLYTIDIKKKAGYYFVSYELNSDELFEFEMFYK